MPRTRQPIKALNPTAAQVAEAAKADKARKAASKKALREATKPQAEQPTQQVDLPQADAHVKAREAEQFKEALREDARALGVEDVEAYVAEQMAPAEQAKTPYDGPMVALKTARKHYTKAANGILCNGSPLAMLCGQFKREVVVGALVDALKLPGNPYAHLNPGQQSMNLRNKARHAIGNGTLSLGEVEAHLKVHAAQ